MSALAILQFDSNQMRQPAIAENWRDFVSSEFFEVDFRPSVTSSAPVGLRAHVGHAAGFTLARFQTSGQSAHRRSRQSIAKATSAPYGFLLVGGSSQHSIRQFRQTVTADRGFIMVDTAEPFLHERSGVSAAHYLLVPRAYIDDRLSDPQSHCGRALQSASGLMRVAADTMTSLLSQRDTLSTGSLARGCRALSDIICTALRENGRVDDCGLQSFTRNANLRRVKAYIRENLSEMDLGPARIAENCGMSVRYIHELFGPTGSTICNHIKSERLRRAKRMLANPDLQSRSITAIAFDCGFVNSGHFATVFKQKYGCRPKEARHDPALCES